MPAANLIFSDDPAIQRFRSLSDAEVSVYAKSCALLYRQGGIEPAISYLLGVLREHVPLIRIFCGLRWYKAASFIFMADTLTLAHNSIRSLDSTPFTPHQISQLMGQDTLHPHILNNAFHLESSYTSVRREDLASFVRIPLFSVGEAKFQMIFCSDIADTFSVEVVRKLLDVTEYLRESLRESFQNREPAAVKDTSEKVRMTSLLRLQSMKGLHELYVRVRQVASTDCTCLILGETGTGKEVVVNALQELSSRASRPFIKVNCGAISEQLVDSELFGYAKGAFTGADRDRRGCFESANGGTIFLDEIGELPLAQQARLLRVLDQREIRRVGSPHAVSLDIRIIAATNCDMRRLVREGRFRKDLWYRLNICVLEIPPLRAHRIDIPTLAQFFLREKAERMGMDAPTLTPEQIEKLCRYDWPGNVRELEHLMERLLVRSIGQPDQIDDILTSEMEALLEEADVEIPGQVASLEGVSVADGQAGPWRGPVKLGGLFRTKLWPSLREVTDCYIDDALAYTSGRISGENGAAALLNVHPNTIRVRRKNTET